MDFIKKKIIPKCDFLYILYISLEWKFFLPIRELLHTVVLLLLCICGTVAKKKLCYFYYILNCERCFQIIFISTHMCAVRLIIYLFLLVILILLLLLLLGEFLKKHGIFLCCVYEKCNDFVFLFELYHINRALIRTSRNNNNKIKTNN